MLKKILIPFIFLGAFSAICATILVGYIIYENSQSPQTFPELPPKQLSPKQSSTVSSSEISPPSTTEGSK